MRWYSLWKYRAPAASILICLSSTIFLMGCIMEDLENGGEENGEEEVNIALLDLEGELDGSNVDLTFSMKVEGQVAKSIEMGVKVSKGTEESWVLEWTLDAGTMNSLNDGQTIFEEKTVTLPDWGPGEYTLRLEADEPDKIEEEDETDNSLETEVEVEIAPPAAPSGLTKTGTMPCAIAWRDNSGNEDGFYIYLGNSCAGVELVDEWTKVVTVGKDVTSYSWTKSCCSVAECSWVLVRAYNEGGESEDSNAVMLAPLC